MTEPKFNFWHFLHVNPFIKYILLVFVIVFLSSTALFLFTHDWTVTTSGVHPPDKIKIPEVMSKKDTSLRYEAKVTPLGRNPQNLSNPQFRKHKEGILPTVGTVSNIKNLNIGTNTGHVGDTYEGIKPR